MANTIVLISGANTGIGIEIVKKLAKEQPNYTILLGSRDFAKGEAAARSVKDVAHGSSVHAVQLDVTSDQSIEACAAQIEKDLGRLDVLANNAGIATFGVTDEPTARDKFLKTLNTNTVGAYCLTEACIPLLKKSDHPRIVFMSSGLGSCNMTLDKGSPFFGYSAPLYAPTKAAMNQLAAGYAVKYEKDGFKVNVCDPGYRATGLNNRAKGASDPAEGAVNMCRLITLGPSGDTGTFSDINGPVPW